MSCASARASWRAGRFGYRRLDILLARESLHANRNKVYRIYAEERLAVTVPYDFG